MLLAIEHIGLHVRPYPVFVATGDRRRLQDLENRRHDRRETDSRGGAAGPHAGLRRTGQCPWQQEHGEEQRFHVGTPAEFLRGGPARISDDYFRSLSSMKLLSIQTRPSSFSAKVSAFSLESFFS